MSFKHGITGIETPTSVVAVVAQGLTPTYVGTAPINMGNTKNVNEPILCYSYQEAVENFGFVKDFKNYTLCEAIDAHFSKFGIGPIVLINVLDPEEHKETVAPKSINLKENKTYVIEEIGVLKDTVTITPETDVVKEFNDEGYLVLAPTADGEPAASITVGYEKLKPTDITKNEIVGGIDTDSGKKKGLECISTVFPKYRLIPNPILAPKYSTDSVVAAVMETKASLVNGHFQSIALIDIDTETVKKYSDVPKTKNDNNLISTFLDVYYPKVALGDNQYHLSTQTACVMQLLANESEDVPYRSPSNQNIKADRACLEDGTDVLLGIDEANYMNGEGINTVINWIGGWKVWGNRTSCFPANTDPKDAFIVSRMMFNYLNNALVLTFWQKVDNATNKNLIKTITDTINIWLNGLMASGYIVGGRVEFRSEDNPMTSLIAGKIKFKIYYTPVLPAEEICFDKEIDLNYYNTLFQ